MPGYEIEFHSRKTSMSSTNQQVPRATIHKKILDAATESPGASFEELAEAVSGASVDLVERVLDEYGDPAESESESEPQSTDASAEPSAEEPTMSGPESLPEPNELTEEQRVVLRAIRDHPGATQSELAEHIGVSASTINRRLHKIDGFDWDRRREAVQDLLSPGADAATTAVASDGGPDGTSDSSGDPKSNGGGSVTGVSGRNDSDGRDDSGEIAALEDRLGRLERQIEELTARDESVKAFGDPELTAKVIRACIDSETVTEEEELRVIERLVRK